MGSTPRKVRTAIVGLGLGVEFIPIHQRHPHAELVAICQRSQAKLDELGNAHGIEQRYTNYADLLSDQDVDAVHINSLIPDHAAVSCPVSSAHYLTRPGNIVKASTCMAPSRASSGSSARGRSR